MNTGNLATRSLKNSLVNTGTLADSQTFIGKPDMEKAASDAVADTHDALLLNEAFHTAQNAPDIRTEKVKALKAQIANGTYEIDIHKLAVNLLREELPLFEI